MKRIALTSFLAVLIILSVVAVNKSYAQTLPELIAVAHTTRHLILVNYYTSGAWGKWYPITGQGTRVPPTLCGIVGQGTVSKQYLFVTGLDNKVHYKYYIQNNNPGLPPSEQRRWSEGWYTVPGDIRIGIRYGPACAVSASGYVMVAVYGTKGGIFGIYSNTSPDGLNWGTWALHPPQAEYKFPIIWPLTVVACSTMGSIYHCGGMTRFDLFVPGPGHVLLHKSWDLEIGWGPGLFPGQTGEWDVVSGIAIDLDTSVAAVNYADVAVDVVVRSARSMIYWTELDIAQHTWGWIKIPGVTTSAPSLSINYAAQQIDLAVRIPRQDLVGHRQKSIDAVLWTPWDTTPSTQRTRCSPAVSFRSGGEVAVLILGTDHHIYYSEKLPEGDWSGWVDVGYVATNDPPSMANVGWIGGIPE